MIYYMQENHSMFNLYDIIYSWEKVNRSILQALII